MCPEKHGGEKLGEDGEKGVTIGWAWTTTSQYNQSHGLLVLS